MKQNNGFTLIELLIVLSILSILLLLSTPLNISSLEKQQEKQFLKTLESDILYIQAMASSTLNNFYIIRFREDSYELIQGIEKDAEIRRFPPGWKFIRKPFNEISFSANGTIKKAGSISISAKNDVYIAVFMLGKGRFYIAKQ
ncbi:hypothetical protein CIL03_02250 [Virgibacillus indicus]|uniref:Competence protein ComG n=1 Tax=Virgibacillus indicus TaxID=2024554 RepID=A0A265NDT9_9BACI|nr:competence type IV pilus minor pilin ComGD [Virgibacillus indicus]OZU89977.1 hypothetical protein CIL03_02250 [Virgibacillus indicus]